MKNKKILIIGAGIHGAFLCNYLSEHGYKITILEKNSDICAETSAATHNRANRGYHYPRSKKTFDECIKGYDYFKKNYSRFLKNITSLYCIEKKSNLNFKKYINFFKKNDLKFKIIKKSKHINKKNIEGIIKAEEGCYDHDKIKFYLKKKLRKENIKLYLNYNLTKIENKKNNIICFSKKGKKIIDKFDLIINSTYVYSEQVSNLFFPKKKKEKKYKFQVTEIPLVYCKQKIPGVTVMDGPFTTIMPKVGTKNHYLLYDVVNSIRHISFNVNNLKNFKRRTNFSKIYKKIKHYYVIASDLKYIKSFYGFRPIPIVDKNSDRSTKISFENYFGKKLITIREGKYISAPYITNKLSKKINKILNA